MAQLFIIIFLPLSSCLSKTDDTIYSLALLFPKNFEEHYTADRRMQYESIFKCYSYYELKQDKLLIYNHEKNQRSTKTAYLSKTQIQEFKGIVEDYLSKTFEGRFMDTVTEFKYRCCDGCTTFVPFIKDENLGKENYNLFMNGLESEERLVAFINEVVDKSNSTILDKKEFLSPVLFAEQFANLQFPLPPAVKPAVRLTKQIP